MFVCVCVFPWHYQQPLFSKPWWPSLRRVMINGHFPVIYLQEGGAVWFEGGETRRAEGVCVGWVWGGGGGRGWGKGFPASDLTQELGFLGGEVHIQLVCASLFIYRALALVLRSYRRGADIPNVPPPLPSLQTPVQPLWVETHPLHESILSNEKYTHQFDIVSATRANDGYWRDRWSTRHTAH